MSRLWLVRLFGVSVFVISNDTTLRFGSVNLAAVVGALLIGTFVLPGSAPRRHRLQAPAAALLVWTAVSLALSHLLPSKAIPAEVEGYSWTSGLNSANWRGVSFFIRCLIAFLTVEAIIQTVRTVNAHKRVTTTVLRAYTVVVLITIGQAVAVLVLNWEVGFIVRPVGANVIRLGGYVGEPQTLAGLLAFGLFPALAATVHYRTSGVALRRTTLLLIAFGGVVGLLLTYSASFIVGVVIALGWRLRRRVTRRMLIGGMALLGAVAVVAATPAGSAMVVKLLTEPLSLNTRTITWLAGERMVSANPISGVGIGQAPLVMADYVVTPTDARGNRLITYDLMRTPPMNTYIEWAAETGFVGFGLLLVLIAGVIGLARRVPDSPWKRFVIDAYGLPLVAFAVAFNSFSGGLYIGYVGLAGAMYISGLMASTPSAASRSKV
jgi:O-antigen ligase